jgi:2-methylfumaryl-CoA hydratase
MALFIALTGDRRPLHCSREFARSLGFEREIAHDLLVFHIVFGRAVPDVSLNSPANLGYADVRFLTPVYAGDTLRAETEVIGRRETSRGDVGIVWVHTRGLNQRDETVLQFYRWAMVNKRDPDTNSGAADSPKLPPPSCLPRLASRTCPFRRSWTCRASTPWSRAGTLCGRTTSRASESCTHRG